MGTSLVATIITVIGSVTGAVIAAIIGAYVTHRLRKKDEDGSNPNEEQAHIQEGNRTTTNNQLSHQDLHNRVALCCSNCHWIWGRESVESPRAQPPPVDGVGTDASQSPSGVATTVPQAQPVETLQLMIQRTEPWGHPSEGIPFDHGGGYDSIKVILVGCGDWIDSLRVLYRKNGNLEWSDKAGGMGGSIEHVKLDDEEYITQIRGYYGTFIKTGIIKSLTFITNKKRKFGPYGRVDQTSDEPNKDCFSVKGRRIVGFHGTEGNYISSIGFYTLPLV